MAPFAHAEDVHCQDVQSAMAEESRLAMEEFTGKKGPVSGDERSSRERYLCIQQRV